MENTKIEWADHTFNPWIGCTKISAGCTNCYAEVMDKRTARGEIVHFGPKADRRLTSVANWKHPIKWDRAAKRSGARARVFCASMADTFDDHPSILPEWRSRLWWLIEGTPSLDWLLLTKRPQSISGMTPPHWHDGHWPENAWAGASIEDQSSADTRIPHLLDCPAPVKFLSIEPLLGPTTLPDEFLALGRKGWVIIGGESGSKARPMHPGWVYEIRHQCAMAGVPFFFKQWGEWVPWDEFSPSKCQKFNGTLPSMRFPDGRQTIRVGKKYAGRMLDFVEWSQFPVAW